MRLFKFVCEYGHGRCTAPDTECPHWIGTYCELDEAYSLLFAGLEEIIDATD